jgi:hypothetical protein
MGRLISVTVLFDGSCRLRVLASGEVLVGLRLFLPESWTDEPERMARAGVPKDRHNALTEWEIAIVEIDRGAKILCVESAGQIPPSRFSPPRSMLESAVNRTHQ